MTKGLLSTKEGHPHRLYEWEEMVRKLLTGDIKDNELAKFIMEDILELCKSEDADLVILEDSIKPVVRILLKEYLEQSWLLIGRGLLSEDWRLTFNLEHLLGEGFNEEKEDCPLLEVPEEMLIAWCKENEPKAPVFISRIMPISSKNTGKHLWHPLAKKIIDTFGHLKVVQSNISANIWSFSSWGSRVPYYEQRLELMKALTDHSDKRIKEWAQSEVERFKDEIKKSSTEDEEWEWGIS